MATGMIKSYEFAFDLLWTNDDPNTAMGAPNWFFDGSQYLRVAYNGYLLFFNTPVNGEMQLMSQFLTWANMDPADYAQLTGITVGGNTLKTRWITYSYFYMGTGGTGESGTTTDNKACIPYKLYGYRYKW